MLIYLEINPVDHYLELFFYSLKENIILNDVKKRKKAPILVGGTGLYFKSLTDGLVSIPNIPIKFREKVRSLHKKIGSKKFFSKLIKLDPLVKNRIKPSDTQRSIRAYEVKSFTKIRNDKTANKAIGIREVNEYLQKKIEIAEVIEKISIKTRQYAKRQRTWANGNMQNWNKINPIQLTDFLKKI